MHMGMGAMLLQVQHHQVASSIHFDLSSTHKCSFRWLKTDILEKGEDTGLQFHHEHKENGVFCLYQQIVCYYLLCLQAL